MLSKLLRSFTVIALLFFALPVKAATGELKSTAHKQQTAAFASDNSPAILATETNLYNPVSSLKLPILSSGTLLTTGQICPELSEIAALKGQTHSSAIVPVIPQLLYPFHGFW